MTQVMRNMQRTTDLFSEPDSCFDVISLKATKIIQIFRKKNFPHVIPDTVRRNERVNHSWATLQQNSIYSQMLVQQEGRQHDGLSTPCPSTH